MFNKKEYMKKYLKKWREKNKKYMKLYGIKWRSNNRCKVKKDKDDYYKNNKISISKSSKIRRDEQYFGGNREKALERDMFSCVLCGLNHHEDSLVVHHKDLSGGRGIKTNNSMRNLMTLCRSCHAGLHRRISKKGVYNICC